MAEYQLTATDATVILNGDPQTFIPNAPGNRHWDEYQKWLAAGGVPDPYVPPEPVPATPTAEQQVLFDHENRLLAQEGKPPLTAEDFVAKIIAPASAPAKTKRGK